MSAELVRRKLLGCTTTPERSASLYFLTSTDGYDVFIDPKTNAITIMDTAGYEIRIGHASRIHLMARTEKYSQSWQKIRAAFMEYMKCQQN